jgi:hypothetical protein
MRLTRRAVRRTAVAGVAMLGVGTLAIAALHHPAARPLLAKVGWSCPSQRVGAAELTAARDYGLAALRGTEPAPERPALGFELVRSGESAVWQWVGRHRLRCRSETRGLRSLECLDAGPRGVARRAARARLVERLGAPTETFGEGDAGYLAGAPFRTAFVRYRFRDYVATVAAVHLPEGGVAVREQYLAVSTAG